MKIMCYSYSSGQGKGYGVYVTLNSLSKKDTCLPVSVFVVFLVVIPSIMTSFSSPFFTFLSRSLSFLHEMTKREVRSPLNNSKHKK